MKKITAIMLLLAASGYATAQETKTAFETKPSAKVGVKAGLNLSNLYVNDVTDENMKPGVNVGFYAKLPITKFLSVQPELIYTMKGAQMTYNNLLGTGKYRFNLNYLEVPVAVVVNVTSNLNINAGPYAGFLLAANVQDVNKDGHITGATELNKDNFESFDYGLFAGAAVDMGNLTIGARYNYGLKNVGRTGLAGTLTRNSKNSVISFYIGLGF